MSKRSQSTRKRSAHSRNARATTDTERLDWVAAYVTAISTLKKIGTNERVELTSADGENVMLTTCSGKTVIEAFRKCVTTAMKDIPQS